jgi:Putative Ig domain
MKNYVTNKVRIAIYTALAMMLASCGGGGGSSNAPCGSASQAFGISFDSPYSLKVGVPATIRSSVTPESCRGDMTFALYNFSLSGSGSLPSGMSLSSGNIVGTPTTPGTFRFAVAITNVKNYQPIYLGSQPHSATVTVTVTP